ncbi:MAG: TraR/DksA C4-type zinc finger protein [Candidatus Parcubacteria bacterium]|nr:MAG: RNA polymerase-binding protein DksA [Candidatus Parcubacteria bacterium]
MEKELTPQEIEKIKKNLIARRAGLMADMEEKSRVNPNEADNLSSKFPEYGDKPDENAQEIMDYSTDLATEQILEKTLIEINGALKRIENGTYGICRYCKNPIGAKRLMARPVASSCISCKTELQENE